MRGREALFATHHALFTTHPLRPVALGLSLRNAHHESAEIVRDLDLAGETRVRPHVIAEVEHVLFHRRWAADLLAPFFLDIDMAGGAGTGPATFGLDAWDRVLDRGFHHGRA